MEALKRFGIWSAVIAGVTLVVGVILAELASLLAAVLQGLLRFLAPRSGR